MSACGAAAGSPGWRLLGFPALCPSPPRSACRIQGLCKGPPSPPPGSQGRAHRGHARSWAPGVGERPDPGLGELVPAEGTARGGGQRLPPISATRAYPGRDGGRAPPFCPTASLGAHLVKSLRSSEGSRAALELLEHKIRAVCRWKEEALLKAQLGRDSTNGEHLIQRGKSAEKKKKNTWRASQICTAHVQAIHCWSLRKWACAVPALLVCPGNTAGSEISV